MNTKSDIVVVGSLNTDLVVTVNHAPNAGETLIGENFQTYCGGKGANQAYAAGKLGASVTMLGQVGDDSYGIEQRKNLSSVGVSTNHIQDTSEAPTGTAVITIEATGENRIVVVPGANSLYTPEKLSQHRTLLQSAKVVLCQLETPLDTVEQALRDGKNAGATTILDPAPARPLSDHLLRNVDFLTPNLTELQLLTGIKLNNTTTAEALSEAARTLCDKGVRYVIVKRGSRGAIIVSPNISASIDSVKVKTVDTTAAGDCFNAAFAHALIEGKDKVDAARFACAAAALSVTKHGAQASMPTLPEVELFIASNKIP